MIWRLRENACVSEIQPTLAAEIMTVLMHKQFLFTGGEKENKTDPKKLNSHPCETLIRYFQPFVYGSFIARAHYLWKIIIAQHAHTPLDVLIDRRNKERSELGV